MKKIEMLKILKDVLDGTSGHTGAVVTKTSPGNWDIYTGIAPIGHGAIDEENCLWIGSFQHFCNKISLDETRELLNERIKNGGANS